jgi:ketosteroid isomerase-like protein
MLRTARGATALLVLLPALACAPPPAPAAPTSPEPDARCAIWARELSFAKSVRDHDAAAFADHVLTGAAFVGSTTLRGRAAIVKGWDKIIRGENARFDWQPAEVVVTSDPHVAMSRGPVWIDFTKDGATKHLLGAYQSTWVRDSDGVWRVAVDGGESPHEVTEEELAKSRAAAPATCPPET